MVELQHPLYPEEVKANNDHYLVAKLRRHVCGLNKHKEIICPICLTKMVRTHIEWEDGSWSSMWMCDCDTPVKGGI